MTRVRRRLHSLRRLASLFDECFALEGMFEASTSKFNMIISILLAEMHSPAYRQTEMLQESTEYMHLLIYVGNFEPHEEMMLSQTSNLCHLHHANHRNTLSAPTHVCHCCSMKLVRLDRKSVV